ncbi:Mov34/MPN/PAD-1 family protein [Guyparkeria sp. 1SP6A2]|nr:Mov34/MPN/PAD-1 family protein [Guyparkeria sp. 1SP6A2]
MGEPAQDKARPPSVELACEAIASLDFCRLIDESKADDKKRAWTLVVEFDVEFPSRTELSANGETKDGIRPKEPVHLVFVDTDELSVPIPVLREDFNPNLPHLTVDPDLGPIPCLSMGSSKDLLVYRGGYFGFLALIGMWLETAARSGLVDADEGWEPIPVFEGDRIVFSSGSIIDRLERAPKSDRVRGRFVGKAVISEGKRLTSYLVLEEGSSLEESAPSQTAPVVATISTPGSVSCWRAVSKIQSLQDLERVIERECGKQAKIRPLFSEVKEQSGKPNHMVVLVALRRPHKLSQFDLDVEVVPFVVSGDIDNPGTARASIMRQTEQVSRDLVERLSRSTWVGAQIQRLALIGAGSLGGKVGAGLSRLGLPAMLAADVDVFNPHNGIRHEFPPVMGESELFLKSDLLAMFCRQFGTQAQSVSGDGGDALEENLKGGSDTKIMILDTTASPHLRERLVRKGDLGGRYANAAYHHHGDAAHLYVEGGSRNPRVDDLIAWSMDRAVDDEKLASVVFSRDPMMEEIAVGMGCQSMTMPMDDLDASALASGISRNLERLMKEGAGEDGTVAWGIKGDVPGSWEWQVHSVGTTDIKERSDETSGWEVRILDPCCREMAMWGDRGGENEACGALVGRVDRLSKRITVTRLVVHPDSPIGSRTRCNVDLPALRDDVRQLQRRSREALTFLGTWHSHPQGGRESPTDLSTLKRFAERMGGSPFVMLISNQVSGEILCRVETPTG